MRTATTTRRLFAAFLAVCFLGAFGGHAMAITSVNQCGKHEINHAYLVSGMSARGFRQFSSGFPTGECAGTAYGAATFCDPVAYILSAIAPTSSGPFGPSDGCQFNCTVGTEMCSFFVNLVNGLPVELLSFSVD